MEDFKIGDAIQLCDFPILSNKLKVNLDWAWMLGFFLAEGTCKLGKKQGNRIEFTNQNMEYLRRCESVFHGIGVECSWYIDRLRRDKCYFLRVHSPRLLDSYFKEFYYNCGKYNEKIIPYYVYDFDKPSRESFLLGFHAGDGSKQGSMMMLNQKSPSIVNGMCYLAQDLDFVSTSIRPCQNDLGEWFRWTFKVQKTENYNIIDKIQSKDLELDESVYDIECETNKFVSGINNVLVHNCEHEDFFAKLSQSKWKVFYNDSIIADRIKDRNPAYDVYRRRTYSEFRRKLQQKYHISGWIKKG
jgi:hypothetical protein